MAKKKTQKDNDKKKATYTNELYGLLLVVLSLIGLITDGLLGTLLKKFACFLIGNFYMVLLLFVLLIGVYTIAKRKLPNFITSRFIGFYIIAIALLSLAHITYAQNHDGVEIITKTLDNITAIFSMKSVSSINNLGGGVIGALFACLFDSLLGILGMKIVIGALVIVGIIMLFDVSLIDVAKKILSKFKHTKKEKVSKRKDEDYEDRKFHLIEDYSNDEYEDELPRKDNHIKEEDNRVVVSSVDELLHVNQNNTMQNSSDDLEIEEIEPEISVSEKVEQMVNQSYKLPPLSILNSVKKKEKSNNKANIVSTVTALEKVLKDFGLDGKVVAVHEGPTVAQYEVELKSGTKVSKVLSIYREIALALAAKDVRIEAPIPGKSTIGIEIPNKVTQPVSFREMMDAIPKNDDDEKLLVSLGKNIMGETKYCKINKTPHLLVAGSTGSGKSVCINGIICSILMRTKPDEVRLVMVDPKKVELSGYNGVPHLLAPVVTDPKRAAIVLKDIVGRMEQRYDTFSETGTKNIETYNAYVEKTNQFLPDNEKLHKLPYIVVIIDELADLMLVAAKEVEDSILRITQMARAAGIHLIIATQRPSTDVITGVIKSNIPSRIAFAVASGIDSRTILDMVGAEKLLGKGDMLYLPMGESAPTRIQGAYITDEEIKSVIDYVSSQQKVQYDMTLGNSSQQTEVLEGTASKEEKDEYDEPYYNEMVKFVVETGKVSASLLQRKYRIGYNRAARAIDLLEERGIIGPPNGSKPREVLVKVENKEDE